MTTTQTLLAEPRWFDEGPRPVYAVKQATLGRFVNTGGIDTSEIDPFRQGTELTQPKHASMGLVKLGTGDVGARMVQGFFGMGGLPGVGPFSDADSVGSAGDHDLVLDGVIEPFALRTLAGSDDDARTVRGTLMGGTEDALGRSPQVESQHELAQLSPSPPYVDCSDSTGTIPVQGSLDPGTTGRLAPGADDVPRGGIRIPPGTDQAMAAALLAMNPASDTYVDVGRTSAATGWTYGHPAGVDSVAFGGQDR